METTKTPWKKNLDSRYISGEDLFLGSEMGKGLNKEMVVTLCGHNDAPAFDSKLQQEVDKTALWMINHETGQKIYKPALLNHERGQFLSKEIGNNSLFVEDFDQTKPFVMYAKPDKRHGHVVAFKKHYPKPTITDTEALLKLSKVTTEAGLLEAWNSLTLEEKNLPTVTAMKDSLKATLK